MNQISTIGYEGADIADFIATLIKAGVTQVIDVRDVPQSRRKGFSKNILAAHLEEKGISYLHCKALGDPKHGREAARAGRIDEFKSIYEAHLDRPDGLAALAYVGEAAKEKSSALLCYERHPQHCHRSMIAERLAVPYKFKVVHLGVAHGKANLGSVRVGERARIQAI